MRIKMAKLQIDLPSEVERAKKSIGTKSSSILLPLVEAIKNSFQAGATKIEIQFPSSRQDIFLGNFVNHYVNSYSVKDNGHGFRKEDIEAFESLRKKHNRNKYKQGCKGYSRIVSLCYFEKISINSISKDCSYAANFSIEDNIHNDVINQQATDKETFTEVKFLNNRGGSAFYTKGEALLNLKTISDDVKARLLIFISLLEIKFEIIFSDFLGKKIILTNKDFDLRLSEEPFIIRGYNFIFHYYLEKNTESKYPYRIQGLCAHKENVEKIIKQYDFSKNYNYVFLISSPYLDNIVNDERTSFDFGKDNENNDPKMLAPSQKEIEENFLSILGKIVNLLPKEQVKNLRLEQQQLKQEFAKENPYLLPFLDSKDLNNFKNDYFLAASNNMSVKLKESRKIRDNILKIEHLTPRDIEELTNSIEKSDILNEGLLAQYMFYRDTVIQSLKKLLQDNNYTGEKRLHELFMRKGTFSIKGDTTLNSDLWLLDDAFMSYDYAVSEKDIKGILSNYGIISDNNNKIDLLVSFNKSKEDKPTQCVLIEFKDIDTESSSSSELSKKYSGVEQLKDYAEALKSAIPSLDRIYAYYIAEFGEKLKKKFLNNKYQEYFSVKGSILWDYFSMELEDGSKFGLMINVLNANNIVYDAEARHQTFMDILRNKYTKIDTSSMDLLAESKIILHHNEPAVE